MIKEKERGAALPSSGRAVASDFDNTLYFMGDEEPMRAADIFAIIYYQQRGGLFGLCTGRSLVGVRNVIGPFIRPDFYILASGALVVDGEENVLFRKCLPIGIVKDIFEEYTPDMKAVIQANDTVYTFEEESYLKTHIDSFDDLTPGKFGVMEPVDCPVIPADRIELMIVPLSSFDAYNHRTGYGRGYYDSVLLPEHLKAGIAFSEQFVDHINADPWDIPLDLIVQA